MGITSNTSLPVPAPPADTGAQRSSPPWHIVCPPLQTLAEPHSWFSALMRQLQPPGPSSPTKFSKPTSRCVGHHKLCLRKPETNVSHSSRRDVQVPVPLKWAESRRGHPATANAQTSLHVFNSTFFLLCASSSTPGPQPSYLRFWWENGPFPQASFSSKKRGKIITDCRCAKNTGKWRQGKVMHDNKLSPAIHFHTPGYSLS